MVYHPGRVLKVFPAEGKQGETAATIRFWDNNLHTVKVSKDIARKIRENCMVLVDYYPISERLNRPKMVAMNIVNEKDEKDLWAHYQDFLRMKKKAILVKKSGDPSRIPPQAMAGVG